MHRIKRVIMVILLVTPLIIYGQQLVYEVNIDTALYTWSSATYFPSPNVLVQRLDMTISGYGIALCCFKKKYTSQYDHISLTGKIGTSIVPEPVAPTGKLIQRNSLFFSQKFLDDDSGWECIANFESMDTVDQNSSFFFKVFDENGTQILSDSGLAYFGFDGQNTYVFSHRGSPSFLKVWKFRSNLGSSITPQPLSKSASMVNPLMAFLPSTGDFRIRLQPDGGGRTSVQIFDILGRCIYTKTIQNINATTTFTIPSVSVPNSPFVTRVENGNGSYTKKTVPMR